MNDELKISDIANVLDTEEKVQRFLGYLFRYLHDYTAHSAAKTEGREVPPVYFNEEHGTYLVNYNTVILALSKMFGVDKEKVVRAVMRFKEQMKDDKLARFFVISILELYYWAVSQNPLFTSRNVKQLTLKYFVSHVVEVDGAFVEMPVVLFRKGGLTVNDRVDEQTLLGINANLRACGVKQVAYGTGNVGKFWNRCDQERRFFD